VPPRWHPGGQVATGTVRAVRTGTLPPEAQRRHAG